MEEEGFGFFYCCRVINFFAEEEVLEEGGEAVEEEGL